jgi:iron complex transport system ATP-binding protein
LSKTILKLSGVSAILSGRKVLSGVSFEVKAGENWAIVGPNGSGKTTLLKIINGYLRPSSGKIEVLGEEFGNADLRELRKQIGFVSSYMNDLISLEDNVLDVVVAGRNSATRLWATPPADDVEKGSKLLKKMGCSRYEDSVLKDLSQGERQKVLIARALMTDPELLALDEPCAGLDLKSRESFLSSLSRIANSVSIIYVTHRIDEIPSCLTHCMLLKRGRVIATGKIGSVLTGANLSRSFDVNLFVKRVGNRFFPLISQRVLRHAPKNRNLKLELYGSKTERFPIF